jgi:DNA polymerase-3 subunit gamma/tau
MLDQGMDPSRVAVGLTQALRDLLVVQSTPKGAKDLGVRIDLVDAYREVAAGVSPAKLTAFLTLASRAVSDLRRSARPRLTLEVALARLCRLEDPDEVASLVERLERLREGLGGGDDGSGPPARPKAPKAPVAPVEAPPVATKPSSAPRSSTAPRGTVAKKTRAENDAPPPVASSVPEPPSADEPPPLGDLDVPPEVMSRAVPAAASVTAVSATASGPAANGSDSPVRASTASSSTTVSPEDARLWTDLILRIRGRKVMLASFLEHGALQSVEENVVTAIFENTYYEGMVGRRDNLALIHEELAHMRGKGVSFRVKLGALPLNGSKPAAESNEEARASQPKDLLAENPGLNRIIHELGGQLLPGGNQFGGG